MDLKKRNIPSIFVIFGATGDLVEKKIFPSLFHLYCRGRLPKMIRIVGFARREISNEEFREFVEQSLQRHADLKDKKRKINPFLNLFSYSRGKFDKLSDYENLASTLGRIDGEWKVCANKLFYLAVPPTFYEEIFQNLSKSGLTEPCSPEEGWTRVIVEKPFGKDLRTAKKLDAMLGKLFNEEQIYRIDHYMGKEMVQNILSFRFGNTLFEEIWNNKYVEKVEVRILEKMGVDGREAFYDGIGALRDVGQNHLLQMLAFALMDQPISLDSEKVRRNRANILSSLKILSNQEIKSKTFRAQYDGYKDSSEVSKSSKTETYFKVIGEINSPRWSRVPIVLEGGKKMPENKKEIIVTFKANTPFFADMSDANRFQNKVKFSLDPNNKITVHFWAKKPGLEFEMDERVLEFEYDTSGAFAEEYERLLLDVIVGNQLLFVSTGEIESMWKFIDPIVESWNKDFVPLKKYDQYSNKLFDLTPRTYSNSRNSTQVKREIGVIGLGKMGGGIARRLTQFGWRVVGYNRSNEAVENFVNDGGIGAKDYDELFHKLGNQKVILVSLPHKVLDSVLFENDDPLIERLSKGDILIDAGNSYYKNTISRAKRLKSKGIRLIDVGVSGGPSGARYGASLMIGGDRATYDYLKPLFRDMAVNRGEEFFEGVGAGHFIKMVHNGIEYGMMQAMGEGFAILKNSKYSLDLSRVASVYNHGSVIESRLVGWLEEAFSVFGGELENVTGTVAHSGEGEWTVEAAREMKIKSNVIEAALRFRLDSERDPSYTGKVVSALRNRFGGHSFKDKPPKT